MKSYNITLLKGDGIGPEIVNEAVKVLDAAAGKFGFEVKYEEALLGGCAIDATGVPLPQETIDKCDYTALIPMREGIDSLNVAAASAVSFWQLRYRGK